MPASPPSFLKATIAERHVLAFYCIRNILHASDNETWCNMMQYDVQHGIARSICWGYITCTMQYCCTTLSIGFPFNAFGNRKKSNMISPAWSWYAGKQKKMPSNVGISYFQSIWYCQLVLNGQYYIASYCIIYITLHCPRCLLLKTRTAVVIAYFNQV